MPLLLLPPINNGLDVRVPEDDEEGDDDHYTPNADEEEEHDTFLLQ